MASKRTFYRYVYRLEMLSEEPRPALSLADIAYEIHDGGCVGSFAEEAVEEVNGYEMAQLLLEFGSEPGFFQLDEQGNEVGEGE